MQLFLAFFVPGLFGWSVDPWLAATLGLSLNASAFLGEIWRGAIESVPGGQWEAATSLGLRYAPKMALVIAPQAMRIAIPPTIGFLVQLIKGTSLASIIGFVELTRAAQVINNATFRPFTIFLFVALIYFMICWPLSLYSRRMEHKLARRVTLVAEPANNQEEPSVLSTKSVLRRSVIGSCCSRSSAVTLTGALPSPPPPRRRSRRGARSGSGS